MIPKSSGLWKMTALFVLGFLGCAAPLSRQSISQVTYTGNFPAVVQEPRQFIGETLILGGKIIDSAAASDGSELVVLQLPLDQGRRPMDEDRSHGRFIVRSGRFLDPEIYKKGALLTLVGRLSGIETRPIGQLDYTYPVFQEVEIKVWPRRHRPAPLFHFGIGVGTTF